jgi:hypothetical protein
MSNNKDDYRGCFLTIAIGAAVILIIYGIGQGCKELNYQMKNNPGDVMAVVFYIGLGAFIIFRVMNSNKK